MSPKIILAIVAGTLAVLSLIGLFSASGVLILVAVLLLAICQVL